MKIALTICSINYLSQAKALGYSLQQYNPDYRFIIGLVDRPGNRIDIQRIIPYEIIEVEAIGIHDFTDMYLKYSITELNTAVKPFFIKYLFDHYPETSTVIYFDPDILVYNKFDDLELALSQSDIILTPHITRPIFDQHSPGETDFLNAGLYNLGFIALKRSDIVFDFLNWWMRRLKDHCFVDFTNGLFVDQIWINFVPLFYKKVHVLHHPGYNMAYWNMQERKLSHNGNTYLVNEFYQLVFFHFSGYKVEKGHNISIYQDRFTFIQRPDLASLFKDYNRIVLSNNHLELSKIESYYTQQRSFVLQNKQPDLKKSNRAVFTAKRLVGIINRLFYYIRK